MTVNDIKDYKYWLKKSKKLSNKVKHELIKEMDNEIINMEKENSQIYEITKNKPKNQIIDPQEVKDKFQQYLLNPPQSPQRIYYHKYSWKVEEIMEIINEIDYKPQNYDELKKYVYITTQIISDYIQNNNTVKKKSSKIEKYQKKMVWNNY